MSVEVEVASKEVLAEIVGVEETEAENAAGVVALTGMREVPMVAIVEDVLSVVENVIVDRRGKEWIAKENRIVRMRTWFACK